MLASAPCLIFQTGLNAGSAYVSTKAGKAERIELYKTWLENAQLIFAIPGKSLSVTQVTALRKSMPAGTTVSALGDHIMIVGMIRWAYVAYSTYGILCRLENQHA